jgi:hypothetical protein
MGALSWVHVLPNLPLLQAKIASLPLLLQLWPLSATPPVNLRSYTAAKEISVSVLLSLSDFRDYATLFLLVHP